ncbi:hypothetical protein J6590_038830, partial [Homalodisca vitripennis]
QRVPAVATRPGFNMSDMSATIAVSTVNKCGRLQQRVPAVATRPGFMSDMSATIAVSTVIKAAGYNNVFLPVHSHECGRLQQHVPAVATRPGFNMSGMSATIAVSTVINAQHVPAVATRPGFNMSDMSTTIAVSTVMNAVGYSNMFLPSLHALQHVPAVATRPGFNMSDMSTTIAVSTVMNAAATCSCRSYTPWFQYERHYRSVQRHECGRLQQRVPAVATRPGFNMSDMSATIAVSTVIKAAGYNNVFMP